MTDDDFDLPAFLPYLLNQAAETCSEGFAKIYKDRYGMLRTEWRVLFHLGLFGPMTASAIGQMSKTHKTKVSRAVQRLEMMRFLRRQASESDRRREILELTGVGRAAYRDLREAARRYEVDMAARLGAGEAAQLKALLQRLAAACG